MGINNSSQNSFCSSIFTNVGFYQHSQSKLPQSYFVNAQKYDTFPYSSIFYLQSKFINQYGDQVQFRGTAFKIGLSIYLTAGHCICNKQTGKKAIATSLIRYQGSCRKQKKIISQYYYPQEYKDPDNKNRKYQDYAILFLYDPQWNKIQPLKIHFEQIALLTQTLQILSHPCQLKKSDRYSEQQSNVENGVVKLAVCFGKLLTSQLQPINERSTWLNYDSNCSNGSSGGAIMIKETDSSQVCIGIHSSNYGGIKLNSKIQKQINKFQTKHKNQKQRIKNNKSQYPQQNNQFKRPLTLQSQKGFKRINKKINPQILTMVGKIFEMSAKNPAFMSKIQGQTFNVESTDLGIYENISTFIKLDKNALVNVKILNLSRNSLNDEFLDKIMQMSCWHNLKELNLSNNKIQNLKSLQNLLFPQSEQFTSLRSLYLHENQLQISIVDFFIQHEWKLQTLSLSFMWGLNEKGWEYFMKKKAFRCFQTLKMLQIYYSNDIQNDDLKEKVRQTFEQKYKMDCIVQWQQSNYH